MIPNRVLAWHGWTAFKVGVVASLVVGALIGGWYLVRVAIAEPKGAADEHEAINDVDNRIQSQEWFFETYEEINSSDDKLQQAAQDKADNPDDDFYTTNYTGLKSHCEDVVGEYNAEAKKVTSEKWRDESLPKRIDDNDPDTDCTEDEKVN